MKCRWIKTQIESLVSEQWCAYYLTLIQDAIWPNGELIGSTKKRTDEEKEKMKQDALQCLIDILPGKQTVSYFESEHDSRSKSYVI